MNIDVSPRVGDGLAPRPDELMVSSRRRLLRGGALAVTGAAIAGNVLLDGLASPAVADTVDPFDLEIKRLLESDPELAEQADHHQEAAEHGEEHHGPKLVDALGTANFFAGIRQLLPGGKGHIDSTRYASLGALLAIKYEQGDETERLHLEEEFKSVAMSGTIIEGTILASEALKLDFAESYRAITDNEIDPRDTIPLLTMFASVTSPAVTTVGSAGILSKQSQELADQLSTTQGAAIEAGINQIQVDENKKQEVYRVLTAHVANLSGFILFGDPPFIAMAEKYGLPKALEYQLHACLPLAVQSLYAANHKLQKLRLESEGVTGVELAVRSRQEAFAGMWRNKEVLAKMMASSVANFLKVATFHKSGQMDKGVQFDFAGMIRDKLDGVMKLASSEHIEGHEAHESTGSRTFDIDPFERTEATLLALKLAGEPQEDGHIEHARVVRSLVNKLAHLLDERDFDRLREFLAEQDMDETAIETRIQEFQALEAFRERSDFNGEDEETDTTDRRGLFAQIGHKVMGPTRLFRRMTQLDRVKNALGHASADVLNVFPFQALSVPFLIPVFRSGVDMVTQSVESLISDDKRFAGLDAEQLRGLAVANAVGLMVGAKSSIADNYVAAKIGLELLPDKPSFPLIMAITGGRLTAIGNMANPTLVPFERYDMGDSIKKTPKGLPSVLHNLVWANVLELAQNTPGFPKPPTPKN